MGRQAAFPILVRDQSVVVKIYRGHVATTRDGWLYTVAWVGPEGRERKSFAVLAKARAFAKSRAHFLAAGEAMAAKLTRSDVIELLELRRLAHEGGTTALRMAEEWTRARELVGDDLSAACEFWKNHRPPSTKRILVTDAIDTFIAEKDAIGKQGSTTYGAKLRTVSAAFGTRYLDMITEEHWTTFLNSFPDPVTRNDIRKRAITLCRWAKRRGFLRREVVCEIEQTELAKETAKPIGILTPPEFVAVLAWIRREHPNFLAAVVLAGFCGLRNDEIHGKKSDRDRRQHWRDIHLERGFLSVTAAKENTPSNRVVHLSEAAQAWLAVCPVPHGPTVDGSPLTEPVCGRSIMEFVRMLLIEAGFRLPKNCFRHSFISYRIARTGDKAGTATEAGNSVKEIDRRYRVPLPTFLGEAWESIRPSADGGAMLLRRPDHSG